METTPRTNIERLAEEGFAIQAEGLPLPKEYEDVIEELDPDAIELIIDVTRRLERAQKAAQQANPGTEPYKTFFPPL
jgi:hypothetical protein